MAPKTGFIMGISSELKEVVEELFYDHFVADLDVAFTLDNLRRRKFPLDLDNNKFSSFVTLLPKISPVTG